MNENERTTDSSGDTSETPMLLQKLMEDMEGDLYPGCKTFKRLEFIMSLLHIKVSNKWSDKSFSMLLNALHRAFNYDNNLPSSSYKEKKYTKALGLDYVNIDACVNHCVLFRKDFANEVKCPKCSAPRWKQDISQDDENSDEDEGVQRKTRLAMHMWWHNKQHASDNDDGIMRHPRDSKSWKSLDELYPEFAADARNSNADIKSFVRNKAHPEGSIAEGYIQKELLAFCARYLSKIETQFNRLDRNEDMKYPQLHSLSVFYNIGKPLGKPNLKQLSIEDWRKAQFEYENDIGHRDVEFCKRFHTKKRQRHRKTQNSGVIVKGDTESGEKDFYGTLDEVIVLYDGRGIKKDKFGSTVVNVSRTLQTSEPFALAFQIEQVFYISSHEERYWKYVIKVKPRNFFYFPNDEDAEQNEDLWNIVEEGATNLEEFTALSDEEINMVRDDVEPELVAAEVILECTNNSV
uniref:Transposase n=1 Tax=Chenopodium quinoa TaxID=63459 RepID=A0A803N991_CHEQI